MDVASWDDGLYMRIAVRRIGRARRREGFGNARAIENLFSQMRSRQADCLAKERKQGQGQNSSSRYRVCPVYRQNMPRSIYLLADYRSRRNQVPIPLWHKWRAKRLCHYFCRYHRASSIYSQSRAPSNGTSFRSS